MREEAREGTASFCEDDPAPDGLNPSDASGLPSPFSFRFAFSNALNAMLANTLFHPPTTAAKRPLGRIIVRPPATTAPLGSESTRKAEPFMPPESYEPDAAPEAPDEASLCPEPADVSSEEPDPDSPEPPCEPDED